MSPLLIAHRYCGPPRSANGGYTAGSLAARLGTGAGVVEVTLRRPPPIDIPMEVAVEDDHASLRHDVLVASAVVTDTQIDPVAPVSYDEAVAASAAYPGHRFHPFPTCFVCGTERSDGLRIFPGPVAPTGDPDRRVAAPWTPTGESDTAIGWAALDCISGWAGDLTTRLMLLGRMTATFDTLPVGGEPHVVIGQPDGAQGRKTMTRSTLYDSSGQIVGRAAQVWITIDPADFDGQVPG